MSRIPFAFLTLATAGCSAIVGDSDKPVGTSDGLSDDDVENVGGGDEPALITGTVRVDLYTTDENGDIVYLDWEDAYGDDFPFGSIFVAAYTVGDDGTTLTYHGDDVVRSPDPGENDWEIEVGVGEAQSLHVYAVLDFWGDGILAPNEPVGIWPDEVAVAPGEETSGIALSILAPWYDFGDGSGGGGGGGGGGAYVTISGDATITESYAGGSCVTMLYDTANLGPHSAASFTPRITDGGAAGSYTMRVTPNWGTGKILAAWDSNYNGLIDPADTWGGYVGEEGEDANPLTIGSEDISGIDVQIPLGNQAASVVPFVVLTGSVSETEGFDAYPDTATVYVAALKYRPNQEFSTADLEQSYDWEAFTGSQLTGTSLDYRLVVPSNTTTYVWAYVDMDGDGLLNESGDRIGNTGDNGKLLTTTSSQSDLDILLSTAGG